MRVLMIIFLLTVTTAGNLYAFKWSGFGDGPSKKAQRLYREAQSAYGSADYSKVMELTGRVIEEDPKFAKAFALRGKATKDGGDPEKAFKDLNRAIELDPKLGEAYFIRAQANEIMGEMTKAKADYKKGCEAGYRSACP